VILEQRDYQARTGKLPELVRLQPLIHTQQNRILVPTAFSQLR
jgi:hypothetical protein